MQHALAQLLARKYPLDGAMTPQSWLFAVGRNYMIDPWRPRRLSLRLFELWQGPRPDYEISSDGDWLAELLGRGVSSTIGQPDLGPEEHVLEEEAEVEQERYFDAFRRERDRWLERNPVYAPVVELIGRGINRQNIGALLGDAARDILSAAIRSEDLAPDESEPALAEIVRGHFSAARAGELLYGMALQRLAQHMALGAIHVDADGAERSYHAERLQRQQETERSVHDQCLSTMPTRRQRAIRLSDDGFTGSEVGILEGGTERSGQLLVNRARKQLAELLDNSPPLFAGGGEDAGETHEH